MTEQGGFAPDPAQNRAAWLAAHPGAEPVSEEQATGQVAAQIGAAAPGPGVSDQQLGAQMAAQGAAAGLPHEDTMNAEMARLRAMVEDMGSQLATIQFQRQQERATAIAALGEPILQRYANAVRDHLKATVDANPGSADHFKAALADAEKLTTVAADTISRGANDVGQVMSVASRIDRFLTKGHARTAPHTLRQLDLSTVAHHLEYLVEEAARLVPGQLVPA